MTTDALTALAARTVSGKTPPLVFRITLWTLALLFIAFAVAGAVGWWRLRSVAGRSPESIRQQGRYAQAGCLLVGAIPAALVGLFLLQWAVAVS